MGALAASVGAPFFALAATGPFLQRWLAATPARPDPYPLYAVANASSLAALAAYPLLVERLLPLAGGSERRLTQNTLWCGGFLLLVALGGTRAGIAPRSPAPRDPPPRGPGRAWRAGLRRGPPGPPPPGRAPRPPPA